MKITKLRLRRIIKEEIENTKNEGLFDMFKKKKKAAAEPEPEPSGPDPAEAAAAEKELDKELEQLSRDAAYGLEHGIKWDVITPIKYHLMNAKLPYGSDMGSRIEQKYGSEKGYPKGSHIRPAVLATFKDLAEDKGYDEALKWARKIADQAYELMGEKREVDRAREEEVKAYQARARGREGGIKTRHAFSEGRTRKPSKKRKQK